MTNFGTMRYKHIISVVLWSMFLVACGPDRRVALAEKLMAEKETDSAIAVMQEIKEPQNNLTDRDYALYALLLSEAMHRKQQLNAETDTLLLPAIKYFSESGDSLYAERALYCKAHLDRRLYRMKDAMQSFLKALLFLQGSGNDEQLYRVNTWLGVVCLNQEEYEGKMRYSKEALKAALRMDNLFYKNLALCDIATGYYFLNRLDSALYYAQAAYDAGCVPVKIPLPFSACMPIRWICSGSWGSMTPLTIIFGKPLPARIWQHRQMPITICPERIIKWDGAMRHTLFCCVLRNWRTA